MNKEAEKVTEKISEELFNDKDNSKIMLDICPDCGGKIRHLSNEIYCIRCGLVFDDEFFNMDFGIDWKGNDTDELGIDSSRAGKPGSFLDGDKYHTGMTEISKEDCSKCNK